MSANANRNKSILIRISGNNGRYDFTYEPSTVNVRAGQTIEISLAPGGPVDKVWVAFEVPVDGGKNFNRLVTAEKPGTATRISLEGVPPGVHHYRVIGFTKEHLVADIYCPSIIVN